MATIELELSCGILEHFGLDVSGVWGFGRGGRITIRSPPPQLALPVSHIPSRDLALFVAYILYGVALSGVANRVEYFDMDDNNLTESGKQKLRIAAGNLPKLDWTYGF